jgi:MYXO-CTERM domain-containing protein
MQDYTADIDAALKTVNGCGCTQTGPGGAFVGAAGAFALLRRRRR